MTNSTADRGRLRHKRKQQQIETGEDEWMVVEVEAEEEAPGDC